MYNINQQIRVNIVDILLNEWFCFGAAGIIFFLKGVGILWFIPGWPIALLILLGIYNLIFP
jgi:hypothetical protein